MTERPIFWSESDVDHNVRAAATGGVGATVWLTGLSGSGKSTIARAVESRVVDAGRAACVLDGDNLRHGLNADLGFSSEDRAENVRRVGEVALLMSGAGLTVLVPVISPYRRDRDLARARHDAAGIHFVEVWVATPLEVCRERDPKGLYERVRAGEIANFTGIDDPYEPPVSPELTLDTAHTELDVCVDAVLALIDDL